MATGQVVVESFSHAGKLNEIIVKYKIKFLLPPLFWRRDIDAWMDRWMDDGQQAYDT